MNAAANAAIARSPAFDYTHPVSLARRIGVSSSISLGLLFAAPHAVAADRVGSESCKGCHASAYETWHASAHAKAAENLSPEQRTDIRCAHCHSPEVGRNLQETAVFGKGSGEAAHAEAGVTCETCHGAGQYYTPSYVMRDGELARGVGLVDPGQKSCLVCHTADAPGLNPFEFASKVKLIDHWSRPGSKKADKPGRASAPETVPAQAISERTEGSAQGKP
jgi:hypothetical protein